ncbi:hypothetical protein BFL43_09410 [Williamsia sp. 1135]|nr:hypothetical protein BFL43_09410 [Williamsia sp. 1135]
MGPRIKPAAAKVADTFIKSSGTQSQLTVRIDTNVHRRFKIATTTADVSMAEIVEDAIRAWLRDHDV